MDDATLEQLWARLTELRAACHVNAGAVFKYQVNPWWWVAWNDGERQSGMTFLPKGAAVSETILAKPKTVYVYYRGYPAGVFNEDGGAMMRESAGLLAALKEAIVREGGRGTDAPHIRELKEEKPDG